MTKPQILHVYTPQPKNAPAEEAAIALLLEALQPYVEQAIRITAKKDFCYQDFARSAEIEIYLLNYPSQDNKPQRCRITFKREQDEQIFANVEELQAFVHKHQLQRKVEPTPQPIPGHTEITACLGFLRSLLQQALASLAQRQQKHIPAPDVTIALEFRNGKRFRHSVTESEQSVAYPSS